MVDVDTCSMPAQDASPKTRKSPQVLAGFVPGALRRRVCFPSEKDRLRMAMVASCTSCGPEHVLLAVLTDCDGRPLHGADAGGRPLEPVARRPREVSIPLANPGGMRRRARHRPRRSSAPHRHAWQALWPLAIQQAGQPFLEEPVRPFAHMALTHRHTPGGGRIGMPRIEEQQGLHPFGSLQARVRTP